MNENAVDVTVATRLMAAPITAVGSSLIGYYTHSPRYDAFAIYASGLFVSATVIENQQQLQAALSDQGVRPSDQWPCHLNEDKRPLSPDSFGKIVFENSGGQLRVLLPRLLDARALHYGLRLPTALLRRA